MKELIASLLLSFFIAETAQGFVIQYKDELIKTESIMSEYQDLEFDLQ